MRRFVPLIPVLALAGCGSATWLNPPFTAGTNPHQPAGASETLQRVEGQTVEAPPLNAQSGDIWPGPLPPTPTLQDLEQEGNLTPMPESPVPGSPSARGVPPATASSAPMTPPMRARGSSTPPPSPPATMPPPVVVPPGSPPSAAAPPPPRSETGKLVQTPSGTGVTTGGSQGYQTMTMPGGGSAIVIPNGNGTSTVIRSDGSIETIPTPKQ